MSTSIDRLVGWGAAIVFGIVCQTSEAFAEQSIRLESGDIILSVNGEQLKSGQDLLEAVRHSPTLMRFTVVDIRTGQLRALQTQLNSSASSRRFGVSTVDHGGEGVKVIEVFRNSPATRCEEDSDLALGRTIGQLIASSSEEGGNSSSDGAIVVYQWPSEQIAEPGTPKYAWRVRGGKLQPTSYRIMQDAFGTNRAKWPPNTICFAVTETEDGRADVTVDTFYDMGITPTSRGGNSVRWEVERHGNK